MPHCGVDGALAWCSEQLHEYGGDFDALVSVECGVEFVDLNCFPDFSGMIISLVGQNFDVIEVNVVS